MWGFDFSLVTFRYLHASYVASAILLACTDRSLVQTFLFGSRVSLSVVRLCSVVPLSV